MAVRGNIDFDQLQVSVRHGTAGQFQMFTGTSTNSHVALFDANGNIYDGGLFNPGAASVIVDTNGTVVGTQSIINIIQGTNMTITGSNNTGANRIDLTFAAAGGGGGGGTNPFGYTPPSFGTMTWVNQGHATVTNTYGPMDIVNTNGGGSWSFGGLVKTIPTAPYRFTANIQFHGVGPCRGGLALYDSVSTKITTYEVYINGNWELNSDNLTTPTSISGNNWGQFFNLGAPCVIGLWMAIYDDGTNRHFQLGVGDINHIYWTDVESQSNTNFLTPNCIGYLAQSDNSGTSYILRVNHESTSL